MELLDVAERCRKEGRGRRHERADEIHAYWSALRQRREGEGEGAGAKTSKACFPRLFEPCAAAKHCIAAMKESACIDGGGLALKLIAVDLACGAGRDIVYVAETMRDVEKEMIKDGSSRGFRKWVFVGADHCARHGDALVALASQRGVHDVEFVATGNMRQDGVVEQILDTLEQRIGGKVAMVMMSRFLDRGLLARVAARLRNAAMSLGVTVLSLSQFEGIDLCVQHGHPRRERDVLREKEMDELVHAWNTPRPLPSQRDTGIDQTTGDADFGKEGGGAKVEEVERLVPDEQREGQSFKGGQERQPDP